MVSATSTSIAPAAEIPGATHGHRRFCSADVYRRRRFARDLDAIIADLYPPVPRMPSTFSLDDDELRDHANDLHRAGWPVAEITSVLDLDERASR
ncbi:MAG TPA: hypothetical protein VIM17_10075 [Jatrophihabitantaceae bacterium]|jgi:hypothetical protein